MCIKWQISSKCGVDCHAVRFTWCVKLRLKRIWEKVPDNGPVILPFIQPMAAGEAQFLSKRRCINLHPVKEPACRSSTLNINTNYCDHVRGCILTHFALFTAQAGSLSYCTTVVVSNTKFLQWSDVHSFHGELIDHTLLKLILMSLWSLQVNYPCRCAHHRVISLFKYTYTQI